MKESQLVTRIIRALRDKGGWWVKIHGGPSQVTGIPDILGCYRGRFVAIEVKLPSRRSKLSKRQRFILRRIRSAGGVAVVSRSVVSAVRVTDEIDSMLDHAGGKGGET